MAFITPAEAKAYAKLVDADPRGPRFTERQAQAIIELQLQRLTGMEQQKIIEELADIQTKIAEYLDILGSRNALSKVIVDELAEVSKDFGDDDAARRSSKTPARSRWKIWSRWKTLRSPYRAAATSKRTAVDTYRRQNARRQGTHWHVHARRGCGRASHHCVDARYLVIFTTRAAVLLAEDLQHPGCGHGQQGQAYFGLDQPAG